MLAHLYQSKKEVVIPPILRHLISISVLFLVAFFFILPYLFENKIIALGESPIYINPAYLHYYSIWEDKLNFGKYSPYAANITLYSLFWSVVKLISGPFEPSVIFIFLCYFLASLSVYACLWVLLKPKTPFLLIPASIFYSFNVFRLLGPINERNNVLFIVLPLFFMFYYLLINTRQWRYVLILVLVASISASTGANLPVFLIPYLLMFFYFCFYLLSTRPKLSSVVTIFAQNFALGGLILLSNLYWLIPLYKSLYQSFQVTGGGTTIFQATSSGFFYDHFRVIGQWAWRSQHFLAKYFPFSEAYDKPFLLFTTYFMSVFSFVYLLPRQISQQKQSNLRLFIVFLTAISLFLLAGNKGPFGFLFQGLYSYVPIFRSYREPFTKFSPLFILAVSFGLTYSLVIIYNLLRKQRDQLVLITSITIIVLINAFPFFNATAMPVKKWNGGNIGYLNKIPEYWMEAKTDIDNRAANSHVMLLPYTRYGTAYNWEYGSSMVGNAADYLLDTRLARPYEIDKSLAGNLLLTTFPPKKFVTDFNVGKFLGLMNIEFLLQENDLEWRYTAGAVASPSAYLSFLSKTNLIKDRTYGKFTPEYISSLDNFDPDPTVRDSLYQELQNQPALVLYQTPKEYLLPAVYSPKRVVISSAPPEEMPHLLSSEEDNDLVYLFTSQNPQLKLDEFKPSLPQISFNRLNSTQIEVTIKNASQPFPLVFSENYDPDWNLYPHLGKLQTILKLPLNLNPEYSTSHLIGNGFANVWMIDPQEFCTLYPEACTSNDDLTNNLLVTIYYTPQNQLTRLLLVAIVTNVAIVVSLVIYQLLRR